MKYRLSVLIVVLALLLASSLSFSQARDTNLTADCVENYDPAVDYFPEKVTITHAEAFTVEYFNHYKVVTVLTPWADAEAPLEYILVQCGTPIPDDVGDATVIEVPVANIVGMSTTFFPHLVGQGLIDRLIGLDTILYTNTTEVIEKYEAGELVEIGGGGSGLEINIEALIEAEPALVMTQRFSAADTGYALLQQTGLPVVINADFMDTTPLGQAEWGKFISLFFNTEGLAEESYAGVALRYAELQALTAGVEDRPTAFASSLFGDSWFTPGGRSYIGQFLADAGAAYVWADDETTGTTPMDFETVLDRAGGTEYWINVFQTTMPDLLATDPRLADFAAVQSGKVYSNNARINANFGSDYYESGLANPDVILADLIRIFHPDLLPDHELVYYKRLDQ